MGCGFSITVAPAKIGVATEMRFSSRSFGGIISNHQQQK
jgi:hypothetical protein